MIPDRRELAEALAEAGADGWLLYGFHGLNPVATRVLELEGLNTRRLFVLLPREGEPVAVAHRIELGRRGRLPGPGAALRPVGGAPRGARVGGGGEAAGDGDLARGRGAVPRPGALRRRGAAPAAGRRRSCHRARW